MTEDPASSAHSQSPDNLVQPFHLASGVFRGRLVRVGRLVTDALAPHGYPAPIARLAAETLALTVGLSATLKYEGLFTLQLQGDGPVRLAVGDVTSGGMVRGVVRFDADRLADAPVAPTPEGPAPVTDLLGRGHLAFTVDQGPHTDRYQGLVALEGDSLAACAEAYFAQSEQVPTILLLAARPPMDGPGGDDGWAASALILQRMPPESGGRDGADWDDAWNTATILMRSLTTEELTSPLLSPEQLLRRPFHGEGLVLAPPRPVFYGCRCSRPKILRSLASFPRAEVADMARDGAIDVTCEFCKATYSVTLDELGRPDT